MKVAMTETAIRAELRRAGSEGIRIELADSQASGLRMRITSKGVGSWALACRDSAGEMRRFPLGGWPALGIADARKRARELRVDVRRGADPIAQRRDAIRVRREKAAADKLTVGVLVGEWESRHLAKRSTRYRCEAVRALKLAFAKLWEKPAADVDRAAVRKALGGLGDRKGTRGMVGDRSAIQRRTAAYGSACWGWALEREQVATNPFLAIPLPEAGASRDRVLTDAELVEILHAAGTESTYGRIIWLLATTGQRASEVGGMRWEELSADLSLWTIPGSRVKNGRAHVVPLSAAAQLGLAGLERPNNGKGLVFGNSAAKPFNRWSECKPLLDTALHKVRVEALGSGAEPIPGWRVHDLRRTLATGLEALGIRLEVTEAVLGHVSGRRSGIVAVYQRHEYTVEKRLALDAWGKKIGLLLDGAEQSDNVIEMRRVG